MHIGSPVMAFNILILTFSSIIAAYRAKGDLWTISFVVSVYTMLVLLFWCLQASMKVPADSNNVKKMYHVLIWSLGALLNIMLSYKVCSILPFAMALIIWAMACFSVVSTFYAFFVCKNDNQDKGN
ncbi:hypothetical protein QJS04_geneDACA021923 [Acorus gramineus]|uniref:MARVEL domain-containing protein n=1 Tax=Acorus gramineus TaxID=55184 RepID=A0AAV9A567_ACOGR|nr:hypothetical protein QJS04_geneDACA021923 [Acorus gramineus]